MPASRIHDRWTLCGLKLAARAVQAGAARRKTHGPSAQFDEFGHVRVGLRFSRFQDRVDECFRLEGDGDVDRLWLSYPGDQPAGLQPLELVLEGDCLRTRAVASED